MDGSENFDHPAAWPVERLLSQCQITRQRASGPGGQHRNKVETAVVVNHPGSGLRGEASERRSQEENRKVAVFRLRLKLAVERTPWPSDSEEQLPPDHLDAIPSPLWRSRVQKGKLSVSPEHDDFPALLAEALTCLVHFHWEASPAASHLGCSSSQLVKFLKQHGPAFARLNAERSQLGRPPLK